MAIVFDVGFRVKGQELTSALAGPIHQISTEIDGAFQNAIAKSGKMAPEVQKAVVAANALKTALNEATTNKGLSFSLMEQSLARSGLSVRQMLTNLSAGGPTFAKSFNLALASLATANRQVITLSSTLQEAGRVFTQSLKFTSAQTAIRFLTSSFQQAVGWVKDLDSAVADIAVVTGKAGEGLQSVYDNIIEGAADLRVASKEYAEASLIFYQQGLNDSEVQRRTQITIESAKAAGQSVETMASQLTAIWNSYQMIGEEQQRAAAVGAKLAASTAVDFKTIAEAMQTAAAPAAQMGVSYNSLAAIIATVGDTTQQSASVIGNAYKTIFSRFQQLTTEGTDGEVTLNSVSKKLQALGINVLDSTDKLRDLDSVILDVGMSWDTYSEEQQLAIAEIVGGTRQYGQFLSLMNNFPKYLQLVKTASEETGDTLVQQFIAARDTIQSAAEMSKEAWNKAMGQLFNGDSLKDFYKGLEQIGNAFGVIIKSAGGLPGILSVIALILQKQISDKLISTGIGFKNIVNNITPKRQAASIDKETERNIQNSRATWQFQMDKGKMTQNDVAANEVKLRQAGELSKKMIAVNKLINEGDSAAKSLGEAMKVAMENANKKFNEGIDKVTQLKNAIDKVKEEAEEQIKVSITAEGDPDKLRQAIIAAQMGEDDALAYQDAKTTLEGTATSPGLNTQVQDLENQIKKSEELKRINTQIADLENQRAQARRSHEAGSAKAVKDLNKQLQALKDQKKAYKDVSVLSEEERKNIEKKLSGLKEEQRRLQELVNSYEAITQEVLDQEKASLKLSAAFARAGSELSSSVVSGAQSGKTALEGLIQEISNKDLPLDDAIRNSIIAGLQDGGIDVSAQEAANRIKSVIEQNLEGLDLDLGVNAQDFEEISEAAQDTTESIEDLTDTENRAGDAADDMKMSASQLAEASVQTVTGITMLAMQMNNLTESFVTGNLSIGQFVTQLLLIAPAALSMASGLRTLVGGLITTFGTVEAGKWTILGFKMALDSATLGITAIISAIVVITAGVAGFIRGEAKRLQETLTENAQKALEMAEATNTATAAIAEAIPVYYEATEGIEKLSRSTQEYADAANAAAEAAQNIINALRDSGNEDMGALANDLEKGLNVAQYTGGWEDLNKLMDETQKKALEISVNANKEAEDAAAEILTTNIKKKTKIDSGMSDTDEIGAAAVIIQNQKLQDYEHIDFNGLGSNLTIKNDGSIEDIIASYEEALDLYDKMASKLSADEQAKSEYFKGLKNYINEAADAYAQYNTAVEGSFEQQSQLFNLDPEAFFKAMKIDPEKLGIENINDLLIPEDGFTSIKEYDEWAEKIHTIGVEAGWTKAQIEQMQTSDKGTVAVQMAKDKISSATQHGRDAAKIANDNRSDLDKIFGANEIDTENLQQAKEDALKILQQAEKELEQHSDFPFSWGSKEKKEEAVRAAQEVYDQIAQAANQEEYLTDIFENMGPEMQKYFNDLEIDPQLNEEELKASVEKQLKKFGSLELQANAEVNLQNTGIYAERQEIVDNLEVGDTISPEQFEKLGAGYEGFFKMMEDGTYQLIEDSELLANQVESLQQKMLLDDSVQVAADAQQYKTEDPELYASMMETANSSQQQLLASADSLRELNDLYATLQANMQEAGVDGVSYTAFSQALIGLASQFENTSAEVKAYQDALRSGNEEQIKIAESALTAAAYIGECAEKYDLNAQSLEIQAKEMKEANKELNLTDEQAAHMAVTNQRLNKGITTLTKNWKNWSKELKKADKTTQDYSDTAADLSDAVADIVGWYDELSLSSEFITENFDLIEGAAEGNTLAILKLGAAVAQESIANAKLDNSLVNVSEGIDKTNKTMTEVNTAFEKYWQAMARGTTIEEAFAAAQGGVADGFSAIQQNMDTLLANPSKLTDILGGEEGLNQFITDLNAYASATGMTAEQMQQMLSSVGVSAKVTTDYIEQDVEVPTYTEVVERGSKVEYQTGTDGDGNPIYGEAYGLKRYTVPGKPMTVKGYVGVAQIDMEGADGSSSGVPPIQFTGKTPPSTTALSGGDSGGSKGGSSSKAPEHKAKKADKFEPMTDRYSTIKAAIDDVGRELEDFSNAEDDAFGAARLAAMKKQEQSLTRQAKLYQTLRQKALAYLEMDKDNAKRGENKKALQAELTKRELGGNLIEATFDDDGFVSNRTEIINELSDKLQLAYKEYKDAADNFDNTKSTDEAESARIDKLKEEYEDLKALVEEYLGDLDLVDETASEARQALLDELEKIREWMQKKVDQANYKLELRMGINERDIQMMELTIRLWDKLGVKMGSTFKNLNSNLLSTIDNLKGMISNSNRMWEILDNISPDSEHQDWFKEEFGPEAWEEYLNGNGALPDSVIQNLEDKADAMMSELSTMYDVAENMLGQFVEAMNLFLEDFDKIADKLSRQNEKLDMFEELLDFSGKKYSVEGREAMMGILQARMDNAKVAVANAKAEQEFTKVAVDEAKASLEQFYLQEGRDVNSYDDTAAFFYNQLKSSLDEAEAAAAEAESKFYSSMQELTAAARAAIEESARIIEEELVDSLGGIFDSFDSGLDMYQHQEDIGNFFLDDYDKGYELKKLLGEIEDAMEDVSDPERLSEWGTLIDDINAANEDGVKITQTDLDILKARFDLQKAYDEYSDARAGKNTMRLQRDASGNYSYVYSDDGSSAGDDSQQKIEDALHNIHKMHREAADEMSSMWFQTYVEMQQYMANVDQLRLENDAEYAAEVQWYKDMYQQKLEHYRDQTIQHNTAIDRSYDETTLGIITGMKDMESTHDWYMQQAILYDEKLKESALSWEEQVRNTCNENGVNYDNLEQTVQEDTELMIQENEALRKKIEELKTDGIRNLQLLGGQIRSFTLNGVNQLREMKRAVEELIQKLQELEKMELAKAEAQDTSGFDAGRDYAATMINYVNKMIAEHGKDYDFSKDETYMQLAAERYNKQMSDKMKDHDYYKGDKDYSFDQEWSNALELAENTAALEENSKVLSEKDESEVSQTVGNQGSQFISWDKKNATASGGLIKTPQVRSLAEEGPELVLNAEDTENILKAVKYMRETVQAQMGFAWDRQYAVIQEKVSHASSARYNHDDEYKAYLDAALAGQEQKVQIEAHFPGVTAASEIEEAFNQLITQAAQYRIRQDR